jgi:hypothetical protein
MKLPLLFIVALFTGSLMANQPNLPQAVVISDFNQQTEITKWTAFTDEVMTSGQASEVQISQNKNNVVFEGELKLEKVPGKGFATMRREGQWNFKNYDRVMFELDSDDREYLFIVKDPTSRSFGTSFQAPIQIGSDNIGIVKIAELEEYFRGSRIPFSRPINLEEIKEVGIMIKDGIPEKFELEMESFWIER